MKRKSFNIGNTDFATGTFYISTKLNPPTAVIKVSLVEMSGIMQLTLSSFKLSNFSRIFIWHYRQLIHTIKKKVWSHWNLICSHHPSNWIFFGLHEFFLSSREVNKNTTAWTKMDFVNHGNDFPFAKEQEREAPDDKKSRFLRQC